MASSQSSCLKNCGIAAHLTEFPCLSLISKMWPSDPSLLGCVLAEAMLSTSDRFSSNNAKLLPSPAEYMSLGTFPEILCLGCRAPIWRLPHLRSAILISLSLPADTCKLSALNSSHNLSSNLVYIEACMCLVRRSHTNLCKDDSHCCSEVSIVFHNKSIPHQSDSFPWTYAKPCFFCGHLPLQKPTLNFCKPFSKSVSKLWLILV